MTCYVNWRRAFASFQLEEGRRLNRFTDRIGFFVVPLIFFSMAQFLVFGKALVVVRRLRVGAKFQHPARELSDIVTLSAETGDQQKRTSRKVPMDRGCIGGSGSLRPPGRRDHRARRLAAPSEKAAPEANTYPQFSPAILPFVRFANPTPAYFGDAPPTPLTVHRPWSCGS
jgi:hypothetical protein